MRRRLGHATIMLGLACLADSAAAAVNADDAAAGLARYLVLAPARACWLGTCLLCNRVPLAAHYPHARCQAGAHPPPGRGRHGTRC